MPGPAPVTLSSADGTRLAALHWAAPAGAPGAVVVHGLGSRKENHADFAEHLAGHGVAAMILDLRGHGESTGALDAGAVEDVLAALGWLREAGHEGLGVRGSSLGGFLALHAAAREPGVRGVVAICPATPEGLARRGQEWALGLPLAATIDPEDGIRREIWHATGDEVVPWRASAALAALAPATTRLRLVAGGGHRTLQHDPAVLAGTAAFLAAALA